MCAKLGIELIAAGSPQAKGRVERVHGTHQDRLVKKLRRRRIASPAEANAYLEAEYLPEHNRRFARSAARPEDYHRRAPCAAKLDRIFRLESERVISDDWVVAVRGPVLPARTAEPELRAGTGQGGGLRVARGAGGDRISRPCGAVAGDSSAGPGKRAGSQTGGRADPGADAGRG